MALWPATYISLTDYRTVIRLHSSAAYPNVTSEFFQPTQYARQRCREAVGKIFELTDYVVKRKMTDKLGPPFAFTVWVAARVLIIQGLEELGRINPDIVKFTQVLKEMGAYWDVARRYVELIERVCHDVQLKAGGGTPATFHILADMRRCAYDLMFSISKQPREEGPTPIASQGRGEIYGQATSDHFLTDARPPDFRNEQIERGTPTSNQRNSRLFGGSMDPTKTGTARARN